MDNNAVFILNEYRALQAREKRDYIAAVNHSRTAAKAAREQGDAWGFCRMAYQAGQLQLNIGLLEDAVATCEELLESEAITHYPEFESRARVLLSRTFHDRGQMHGALVAAREASAVPGKVLSLAERWSIQHVLIASLAEEGDIEHAWIEAINFAKMLEGETNHRVLGMAQWAIGNVAFLSSRVEEGLEYHNLAAANLSTLEDVNLWAQFNKATAHVRMAAGLVGPETAEFVERAELAFAVAGGNEIDLHEVRITRAWWELESGNAAVAEGLLRLLEKELAETYPFLQARSLLILARCLCVQERKGEALQCAQKSERIFAEVGAAVYASESREIIDTIELAVP